MATPPIEQHVTFVYTDDLAASAAFYETVLGLALALDQGGCRIYRVAKDAFLGICAKGKQTQEPGGVILTFVTPDVDAWYAHLKAAGVALETPPAENERYKVYHFFARDPGGYLIEFQRFLAPAWPAPA